MKKVAPPLILEEACHMNGIAMSPQARVLLAKLYEKLRPGWMGGEREFVIELVTALASLKFVTPKIANETLLHKLTGLNLAKVMHDFKSVMPTMTLTERECLWLTLHYLDAYRVVA